MQDFVREDEEGGSKTAQPENGEIVLASDYLPDLIPLIPMAQRPSFPGMLMPVMLHAGKFAEAAREAASSQYKTVGLVLTKEIPASEAMPESPELLRYGTAAKILKSQSTEEGHIQLLLNTLKRFHIRKLIKDAPHLIAAVQYFDEPKPEDDDETSALTLAILGEVKHLANKSPLFSEELKLLLTRSSLMNDPGRLTDMAASLTTVDRDMAQKVLETMELRPRMRVALTLLKKEHTIVDLQADIGKQIEEKISNQQREFFLREQLKTIKKELGLEQDEKSSEVD